MNRQYYSLVKDHLAEHAIRVKEVSIDLAGLMERKEKIVSGLTGNVGKLLEKSGVTLIRGSARLKSGGEIEVLGPGPGPPPIASGRWTSSTRSRRTLLLATGSEPVALPFLPFDGQRVVSSTEALKFASVPRRLGIAGGGYIGLELGSVWSRLGSEVTVIEALPQIATALDGQVSRFLERMLRREGLNFRLATRVVQAENTGDAVKLLLDSNGVREEAEFDKVLVAVGRRPLTSDLGLDESESGLTGRGSSLSTKTTAQTFQGFMP